MRKRRHKFAPRAPKFGSNLASFKSRSRYAAQPHEIEPRDRIALDKFEGK